MKLSSSTRYAIRILLELSGAGRPLSAAVISEKTGITPRAVENIHAVLRRCKITFGTVGAKGGIELIRPLAEISLGTLVQLFDNGVEFAVCCGDKSNDCPNQESCGIRAVWRDVSARIQRELDAVSLEDIVRGYPEGSFGHIAGPGKIIIPVMKKA